MATIFKIPCIDNHKRIRFILIKEIKEWCTIEFGPPITGVSWDSWYNTTWAYESLTGTIFFRFQEPRDAVYFKLVWGEYCIND